MLEGKKVIIFDMDGTLIDSVGVWNDVDRALIGRIRASPGSRRCFRCGCPPDTAPCRR